MQSDFWVSLIQAISFAVQSEVCAAWVQAIGSIIAIVIAIYIPWRLHTHENKEQELDRYQQERGLVFLIYPHVLVLKQNLEEVTALSRKSDRDFHELFVREKIGVCIAIMLRGQSDFELPESVKNMASQLYIMRYSGEKILRFFNIVHNNIYIISKDKKIVKEYFGEIIDEGRILCDEIMCEWYVKCYERLSNSAKSTFFECEEILKTMDILINTPQLAHFKRLIDGNLFGLPRPRLKRFEWWLWLKRKNGN